MKKIVIAAACGAMIFAANSGTATAGDVLSAKQIKKFVPGRAKAKVMGSKVTMRMSRGGSLSAKWDGKRDTGVWRVTKNKLCIKFKKWMNGATRCSSVTRSGNSYRVAGITFSKY